MFLSVLLCAHRPRPDHLRATLLALRSQTLPPDRWELLLIDSASTPPLLRQAVCWHPHGRLLREEVAGLTRARQRGMAESRGDLLLFCDDDNVFRPDYLEQARRIFEKNPELGAAGGKSLPAYESEPPSWLAPFADRLALRDLGHETLLASWKDISASNRAYPSVAPIGAGLVLRRSVATTFMQTRMPSLSIPDRMGTQLSSGGDNVLVLAALSTGWSVGYFPQLVLTHLIPQARLRLGYLARLNRSSSESWVQVLANHGLNPWRPISRLTLGLRQLRAFFRQKAWRNSAAFFSWAGACGILAGRANLSRR